MSREDLAKAIVAACKWIDESQVVIFVSQSLLGSYDADVQPEGNQLRRSGYDTRQRLHRSDLRRANAEREGQHPRCLGGEDSAFRFYLEDVPRVWLEGSKAEATLSHGMSLSIPAFITAVIAHPKVTGKAATAWPKPVQP